MTISKKLLIVSALILGMQQIAQAHTSEVNYEVSQMLNFAQTLRQVNHKDALKVAQWLEQQACDTSYNVQDHDILAIANIINNNDLTMQSKISVFLQTIATQRNTSIRRTIDGAAAVVASVVFFGCFATIATVLALEEIKNPTPRRTITYTYRIPAHQQTNYYYSPLWW